MTDWQPITEPPPAEGWYLCFWEPPFDDHEGSVHCLKWEPPPKPLPGYEPAEGKGKWLSPMGSTGGEPHITHWMPLPPGPGKTLQASARKNADDILAMNEQDNSSGMAFSAAWEIVDPLPGVWSDDKQKLGAKIALAIDAAKVDVLTHIANWSPK